MQRPAYEPTLNMMMDHPQDPIEAAYLHRMFSTLVHMGINKLPLQSAMGDTLS